MFQITVITFYFNDFAKKAPLVYMSTMKNNMQNWTHQWLHSTTSHLHLAVLASLQQEYCHKLIIGCIRVILVYIKIGPNWVKMVCWLISWKMVKMNTFDVLKFSWHRHFNRKPFCFRYEFIRMIWQLYARIRPNLGIELSDRTNADCRVSFLSPYLDLIQIRFLSNDKAEMGNFQKLLLLGPSSEFYEVYTLICMGGVLVCL